MFKVIYYYFFLFFSKYFFVLDDKPHWSTIAFLTANQILIVSTLKDIFLRYFFCYDNPIVLDFIFMGIIFVLNFYYYDTKKKGIAIEEEKPLLFGSKKLSITITILFVVVAYYFLFASGPILKSLSENC